MCSLSEDCCLCAASGSCVAAAVLTSSRYSQRSAADHHFLFRLLIEAGGGNLPRHGMARNGTRPQCQLRHGIGFATCTFCPQLVSARTLCARAMLCCQSSLGFGTLGVCLVVPFTAPAACRHIVRHFFGPLCTKCAISATLLIALRTHLVLLTVLIPLHS